MQVHAVIEACSMQRLHLEHIANSLPAHLPAAPVCSSQPTSLNLPAASQPRQEPCSPVLEPAVGKENVVMQEAASSSTAANGGEARKNKGHAQKRSVDCTCQEFAKVLHSAN